MHPSDAGGSSDSRRRRRSALDRLGDILGATVGAEYSEQTGHVQATHVYSARTGTERRTEKDREGERRTEKESVEYIGPVALHPSNECTPLPLLPLRPRRRT